MPAYKTPQRFPGVSTLPQPVQKLTEMFFPPDELPTPAIAPISPTGLKQSGIETLKRVRTLPTLSGLGHNAVSALTMLQQRYPRLFGTVDDITTDVAPDTIFRRSYGAHRNLPGNPAFSKLALRPNMSFTDAAETAAHELTHAAQQVRQPRTFPQTYDVMDKVLGYAKNPFEVRARQAGRNFVQRIANPRIK